MEANSDCDVDATCARPRYKNKPGWRSKCRAMERRTFKSADSEPSKVRKNPISAACVNEDFERYYQDQGLIPLSEWDSFMECNRRRLPISFRLNSGSPLWELTLRMLRKAAESAPETKLEKCLDHIPDYLCPAESLYYRMDANKSQLKSSDSHNEFRRLLVAEDTRGAITRQEITSMLPAIYLDPNPGENVLDLCAAPGMKFMNILDILESKARHCDKSLLHSNAIVIGNDSCQSRLSTLSHHVKHMSSPVAAISNFDASQFPFFYKLDGTRVTFDKILADVPCSCDGTLRKSVDIWQSWTRMGGVHMHKLQVNILRRGLELLAPGGLLIYSTCSLNPLENEAVANYILMHAASEYHVELVKLPELPGIRMRRGLLNWLVPSATGGYLESYEDHMQGTYTPGMFRSELWTKEEAAKVIRILPHDSDTGGFFIMAVKKSNNLNGIHIHKVDLPAKVDVNSRLRNGAKLLHEHELWSLTAQEAQVKNICNFYGIDHEWASTHFVIKRGIINTIHITNDALGQKLVRKASGQSSRGTGWIACKFASLGVRTLDYLVSKATHNAPCKFRPCHEGVALLLQVSKRRIIYAKKEFAAAGLGDEVGPAALAEAVTNDVVDVSKCQDESGKLVSGGCILVIKLEDGPGLFWKGSATSYTSANALEAIITAGVISDSGAFFQYSGSDIAKSYRRLVGL